MIESVRRLEFPGKLLPFLYLLAAIAGDGIFILALDRNVL